jgi:hypothetical protein
VIYIAEGSLLSILSSTIEVLNYKKSFYVGKILKKELIVLLVLLGVFHAIGCTDNGNEATNETGIQSQQCRKDKHNIVFSAEIFI